jgi:hypothetical protein
MSAKNAPVAISMSALTQLAGPGYSSQIPGTAMLSLACSALAATADEIDILRHAIVSDEVQSETFDLVLWRLAERMRAIAEVAWDTDSTVQAARQAAKGES